MTTQQRRLAREFPIECMRQTSGGGSERERPIPKRVRVGKLFDDFVLIYEMLEFVLTMEASKDFDSSSETPLLVH
jgi:hypothetical protein